MAPQLPIELIDIIVDHYSTDKETLLALLSASRRFKRARRYLYRRVCITFEPRNAKRGLPLFRFHELVSFYGAEIGSHVQSIELRQLMLIMKGAYGRRNDLKKLRQVLEQLTGLTDMVLEFLQPDRSDTGTSKMFKALLTGLASPCIQSLSVLGPVDSIHHRQHCHAILPQFPGLKTLVLSGCPFETLPPQHGIQSVYIFSWISSCLSPDLHSSRVGPPCAYWKWRVSKVNADKLYPDMTAQMLQHLDAIVLDTRYCETIGERLTSLASLLCPENRVRMIGFVFRTFLYKGMLTSPEEARAWSLFFARALESGVKTLCFTFAPYKEAEPIKTTEHSFQLFRSQSEALLASSDPSRKLRRRYAISQDTNDCLSVDSCLLPM